MFKVANARHDHRHVMFIAEIDAQLVFNGPTWLNNGTDTRFVCNFNTIWERKKYPEFASL